MTEHDAPQGAGSEPSKGDGSTGRAREAAWDEVAAHISNLGKQLRSRFERPADQSQTARESSGGETAVRRWIDSLDETFTKLGDTVRDPAFRREAGSSVGQLGQALGVTLRELGDQLQARFGRARTGTAPGEDMPDVPPPPTSSEVPPPPPTSTPPSSEVPPAPPTSTAPSSEASEPPHAPAEPGTETQDESATDERPPA